MSRLITAIIIFSLIIAGSGASVCYVSHPEKQLQSQLDEIVNAVSNDDIKLAEKLSEDLVRKWDKTETIFIMLIRHHSVDEITKYVSRLTSYCKYENRSDLLADVNMIKTILRHMSEDEKPTLHNFF